MKITLSRHAKRRAKLYGIPELVILDILNEIKKRPGRQEIIKNVEGFKFPLKIIISVEGDHITVITNYPLKKGKNESSL